MNRTEVESLDAQITALEEKRQAAADLWVENECPVKIGDNVEVTGHSSKGKRMIIDQPVLKTHRKYWRTPPVTKYSWFAMGWVLKADNTIGIRCGAWEKLIGETTNETE